MTPEKKTIRSDIPNHHMLLNPHAQGEEKKLVIGRGIALEGNINDCCYLVVEGKVASLGLSVRRLDVLEGGVFTGAAAADDVVIAGSVEGSLKVNGRLVVRSGGRLTGKVSYQSLEVETGGEIAAELTVLPTPAKAEPVAAPAVNNVEPLFDRHDNDDTPMEHVADSSGAFRVAKFQSR